MSRAAAAFVVAAGLVLVLPAAAFAHASLKHTEPVTQSRVEEAPREIVLRFDQSVSILPNAIQVFGADGTVVSGTAHRKADHRVVSAPLADLPRGAYTVRWRTMSADGHSVAGVFTFGVRVAAPPPTEAYGSSGPGWSDDVARWAYFVSLAVLLGTLGVRLVVLRGTALPRRLEKRLSILTLAGALGTINVGVAAFVMRAEDALQLPFMDLLYGDISPIATKTRFGVAFVVMTLGYAWVLALLLLGWILERPRLLWPAFLTGLALASGLSLSGHSAVEPNSGRLSTTADWVHLGAASLWAGGVLALAVCVWPLAPELRRRAFVRFSRYATVLVALLLLAGVYLSILRLPAVADLWETGYGRTLLLKVSLVAVALLWGAVHQFVVRPRLERGGTVPRVRASLLGESTVAMAVLLVAAVLVNSPPPPPEPTAGEVAGAAASPGR
jgi:copper transport protein